MTLKVGDKVWTVDRTRNMAAFRLEGPYLITDIIGEWLYIVNNKIEHEADLALPTTKLGDFKIE